MWIERERHAEQGSERNGYGYLKMRKNMQMREKQVTENEEGKRGENKKMTTERESRYHCEVLICLSSSCIKATQIQNVKAQDVDGHPPIRSGSIPSPSVNM